MKALLLPMLTCPVCRRSLKFAGDASDDRLFNGVLRCFSGHLYQIKDEIPILKDPKLSEKEFSWNIEFPSVEKYDEIRKNIRLIFLKS